MVGIVYCSKSKYSQHCDVLCIQLVMPLLNFLSSRRGAHSSGMFFRWGIYLIFCVAAIKGKAKSEGPPHQCSNYGLGLFIYLWLPYLLNSLSSEERLYERDSYSSGVFV